MTLWHAARRLASSSAAAMRPLRVGVVGAGAVGTYFGVRLAELGHDVRFLVRKRHDAPKKLGVTSWQGDFVLEGPTIVREASELGDDLDWVLVGLKSTALEQENVLRDLLEPCVAPNTRVQLLMNGLGAEEKAAEIVDARRVHGGLVYGGLSRRGFDVNHAGVPCAIHGGSFVDDEAELAAAERLWTPVDREKPKGAVAYVPQPCLPWRSGPSSRGTCPSTAARCSRPAPTLAHCGATRPGATRPSRSCARSAARRTRTSRRAVVQPLWTRRPSSPNFRPSRTTWRR